MAEPELNEIIKAYAEKKGITPTDAMLEFKKNFVHRSEVADAALNSMKPYHGDGNTGAGSEDLTHAVTESSRVELKKLELENKRIEADQKRIDAEQRKQDFLEKKLEMEMQLQREKLDRDEKLQQRKLDSEETWRQRQAAIAEERSATERLILLHGMTGKKPDELLELMKSQSGMALDMVKTQAAGTEKMYQTLLEQKNAEKDREMEIKTALAKIESDRDVQLAQLRQEADAETASQMDILIQKMDEKFGPKIEKMPSSAESFINQMQEYKKMQDQFLTLTFDTLEARGFDKDQISIMKKAAKIEEAKQDTTVDTLLEVGKNIYKNYIKPNIDKAERELSPPPQQQQQHIGPTPEQAEQQREYQRRIAEQERIKAEVIKKQEENAKLQAQLDQEKHALAQRQQLEDRAVQLGIAIYPTMTDRQISDLIVRQEFIYEQGRAQRDKLDAHAINIGITPDDSLSNEQLFDEIEHREAEIEQHRKSESESPVTTPLETEPTEATIQAELKEKRLAVDTIYKGLLEPQVDIKDELTKPPEVSKETEEFLSGRAQVQAEPSKPSVAELTSEIEPEGQPGEAPKKKGRKKKDKQDKQPNTYQITRDDGEPVGDVEAKNPHGAAMKAARITGATDESPVTLKISGGGLDKEQMFKVSMAEVMNRGKKTWVAKAERV